MSTVICLAIWRKYVSKAWEEEHGKRKKKENPQGQDINRRPGKEPLNPPIEISFDMLLVNHGLTGGVDDQAMHKMVLRYNKAEGMMELTHKVKLGVVNTQLIMNNIGFWNVKRTQQPKKAKRGVECLTKE